MGGFLQSLEQRKRVQWALAYLSAAWVLLQALDLAADSYDWRRQVMQFAFGMIAIGFVITLVLAIDSWAVPKKMGLPYRPAVTGN